MDSASYLLPEDLLQSFAVEDWSRVEEESGGYVEQWVPFDTIDGTLAAATTREMMVAQQLRLNTSHIVVSQGAPRAEPRQRLRLISGARARYFRIDYVDNPGDLDEWTLYYTEEVIPE